MNMLPACRVTSAMIVLSLLFATSRSHAQGMEDMRRGAEESFSRLEETVATTVSRPEGVGTREESQRPHIQVATSTEPETVNLFVAVGDGSEPRIIQISGWSPGGHWIEKDVRDYLKEQGAERVDKDNYRLARGQRIVHVQIVKTREGFLKALAYPNGHVVFQGHAYRGRGPVFPRDRRPIRFGDNEINEYGGFRYKVFYYNGCFTNGYFGQLFKSRHPNGTFLGTSCYIFGWHGALDFVRGVVEGWPMDKILETIRHWEEVNCSYKP